MVDHMASVIDGYAAGVLSTKARLGTLKTGQPSIRLPLPDPAALQRLARAFEPWLQASVLNAAAQPSPAHPTEKGKK